MRRLALGVLLVAVACTEEATAPGDCPNFCPGGQIVVRDSIFTTIIERDSAFRGYILGYQSGAMTAADLPGMQSRALFVLNPMITRVAPKAGDTTTVPIVVDSSRLRLTMLRRNRATTNLWLKLYAIPTTTDSTATFASLDPSFAAPPIDSVNVDSLLARPAITIPATDTVARRAWGDSIIRTDSAGHTLVTLDSARILRMFFDLDTLQAPFVVADSGRLGLGIRVTADSLASATFGTTESGSDPPNILWYYHYTIPDTVSGTPDSVVSTSGPIRVPRFDGFVFDPPTAPLDSNLTVGGAPSARSLVRVTMPAFLRDSFDIVRATAIFVPVAAVPGSPADSFGIQAYRLQTDLGAKSPLVAGAVGSVVVHTGSVDTVRIELTDLVRAWAIDTTLPTMFFLIQQPEATSFTEMRFYSSRAPAFRPALYLTYVKRFPFGKP
jgi:hypothetical protein